MLGILGVTGKLFIHDEDSIAKSHQKIDVIFKENLCYLQISNYKFLCLKSPFYLGDFMVPCNTIF